jgi:outer membrane protein assembly factor BamB
VIRSLYSILPLAAAAITLAAAGAVELEADDWPEWRGRGRLGVWNETGIVDTFPPGGLTVRWRTPIHAGYAGPSVAGGRVFITDSRRIRGNRAMERALALDEATGKILWTAEWETDYTGLQLIYAIGPRATPTVDGDRVYTLGAMGRLTALEAATGRVIWHKDFVRDFGAEVPSWGMASAPLVDGDRLIVVAGGEPDAKVMAFNKHTGEEIWRALSSAWEPGYNQPTIIEAAGVRQLIIWHPRAVSALDPATGRVYWDVPSEVDMGMTVATPVRSGPFLLVTSFYNGARMLRLDLTRPGATMLWSGKSNSEVDTDTIHSTISTPVIDGDYIYGIDSHGELRCLEAATGRRVWESQALIRERARWATAFLVKNGDRYFINNDRGELVIARLSPKGFEEISRTQLIEPTHPYARRRELGAVHWSHPAYANRHVFVRNDRELLKASLEKDGRSQGAGSRAAGR